MPKLLIIEINIYTVCTQQKHRIIDHVHRLVVVSDIIDFHRLSLAAAACER